MARCAPNERLRVLVSGRLVSHADQGGASWATLQYVLGLKDLGHDVRFLEPIAHAHDEAWRAWQQMREAIEQRFGLAGACVVVEPGLAAAWGAEVDELRAWCRHADVLLNLSGVLVAEALTAEIPVRLYVDLDPGFTQLWHGALGVDMGLAGHTHYATVGLGLGRRDCLVPTLGFDWIPTVPPVVLSWWPSAPNDGSGAFTTVGHWRSYGSIRLDSRFLGQRAHTIRQFVQLPKRTTQHVVIALGISPEEHDDINLLRTNGWELVEPARVAGTPDRYQRFIRSATAELGLPKSGYVSERTGWFSDRSAAYLATGRPVVTQDTGVSSTLPCGEGLLTFDDLVGALEAIEDVAGALPRHAKAARALAEEHFDSRRVLGALLAQVMAAA